jgi:hypothetical protein
MTFLNGWALMQMDSAPFRPYHDVFGSLQGAESAQMNEHFKQAWDQSVRDIWKFTKIEDGAWRRDWTEAMAPNEEKNYVVKDVAEWLWRRFIADGLKNFGSLERSQVYALLASGLDYQTFYDSEQPYVMYSETDLQSSEHLERLQDLEISRMGFLFDDEQKVKQANQRVGLAIAFISATPYMFLQEGL